MNEGYDAGMKWIEKCMDIIEGKKRGKRSKTF